MKTLLLLALVLSSASALAGKVLYIGDSHSYLATATPADGSRRLGHVLVDGLKGRGHEVDFYAACGSAPGGWINGANTSCGYTQWVGDQFSAPRTSAYPALRTIYRPEHELLVINLGDNMFAWYTHQDKRWARVDVHALARAMTTFVAQLPAATPETCVWVGPTYHREGSNYFKPDLAVDALYVGIQMGLNGKCRLIDSRGMVDARTPGDGLHHTNADSATWGQGILDVL